MLELPMNEFLSAPEKYMTAAVENDDFFKVYTKAGRAVVVSEAEWNIMREAFETLAKEK